jgi:hypothetical protein
MTTPRRLLVPALALVGALATASAACSTGKTDCSCFPPGAYVDVPPADAAEVVEVRLSGPACAGQKTTCTQPAAVGCATYSIQPAAPGVCHVDVVFVDTTFSADVTFEQSTGCCSGLYATPSSAGTIDAVHGPSDAGGAGG